MASLTADPISAHMCEQALAAILASANSASSGSDVVRILDVACGDGAWLMAFIELCEDPSKINFHGLDLVPRPASLHPAIIYHQASAHSLPFPASSFDLVHTRKLLSFLDGSLQPVLSEALSVLRPGKMAVWVEGRNAADEPPAAKHQDPRKALAMRKTASMLRSKGLEPGDLRVSLPRLMTTTGFEGVAVESIIGTLFHHLDGGPANAPQMTAFVGKKPFP